MLQLLKLTFALSKVTNNENFSFWRFSNISCASCNLCGWSGSSNLASLQQRVGHAYVQWLFVWRNDSLLRYCNLKNNIHWILILFVELVLISRWITTNYSFFVASEFSGIPLTIHHLNADFFRGKKPCNLAHPFVKNKTFNNLLHINPGVRIYSVAQKSFASWCLSNQPIWKNMPSSNWIPFSQIKKTKSMRSNQHLGRNVFVGLFPFPPNQFVF